MGKYLELLDRTALREQRRDKSDKSDKRFRRKAGSADFGRLCRFGRNPDPAGTMDIWGSVQEERAAVIEYDGRAPRDWAEALARLDPEKPPRHVPRHRWQRFIDDCGRFLDAGWADKAAALGWGPLQLFGCDRKRPYYVPHRGTTLGGQRWHSRRLTPRPGDCRNQRRPSKPQSCRPHRTRLGASAVASEPRSG